MTPWARRLIECTRLRTALWQAGVLLSLCTPGLAHGQVYSYYWYPGTGLLPEETCPRWTLLNTADTEVPDYNPVRLRLSTSTIGEVMTYTLQDPDFNVNFGQSTFIEFRMRYVSGSTNDATRRVASVLFQSQDPIGGSPVGNILWIGQDEIFLWSADATVGPTAAVDTDDDYHTYVISWNLSSGVINVYRDGSLVPTLTGAQFTRPQWTTEARIAWGHQYFGAPGESRWQYIAHNLIGPNGGGDEDGIPDSCDNCANANPAQDDIDHDGVGNLCDSNDSLQIQLHSPVDMVVTDPGLDSIGKTFNFIGDASSYTDNTDVSGDGQADDIVSIPRPKSGPYLVRIFPEPGAAPDDQYTLTIRINGNQVIIPEGHQDATVSSLPAVFVWNSASTLCGDVNADSRFTAADIIYLVNFVFKGGPAPVVPGHGDTNCDVVTTSADIIRMVNFVFKSSTPPCSRTADFPG